MQRARRRRGTSRASPRRKSAHWRALITVAAWYQHTLAQYRTHPSLPGTALPYFAGTGPTYASQNAWQAARAARNHRHVSVPGELRHVSGPAGTSDMSQCQGLTRRPRREVPRSHSWRRAGGLRGRAPGQRFPAATHRCERAR
eukprot:1978733-Rhodomonas_salina.4